MCASLLKLGRLLHCRMWWVNTENHLNYYLYLPTWGGVGKGEACKSIHLQIQTSRDGALSLTLKQQILARGAICTQWHLYFLTRITIRGGAAVITLTCRYRHMLETQLKVRGSAILTCTWTGRVACQHLAYWLSGQFDVKYRSTSCPSSCCHSRTKVHINCPA